MTATSLTSVPITALGDPTRRDQYGRYMVVPPGGTEPVGYTRVTTVAKVLDPEGGLAEWKAAMTATGMIRSRGRRAMFEALLAEHPNPWYDSEESKRETKRLVEDLASVGGADDRRYYGTALHSITALLDAGNPPSVDSLSDETAADVLAYAEGLSAAGIVLAEDYIERTVVLDGVKVAGTFDRLAWVPGFDLPLIADLKTGEMTYSWHSTAVQLAAYSRGDHIYQQGAATDGSDDIRIAMPECDMHFGLVMHLPAGTAKLALELVDLDVGWEAFEHSLWAREWTASEPHRPLGPRPPVTNDTDLGALLEQSIAMAESRKTADYQPNYPLTMVEWLQARIDTIGKHTPEARKDLAQSWPADVPTLRHTHTHTDEQYAQIEQLLIAVEARHGVPFPEPRPGFEEQERAAMLRVLDAFPDAEVITTNQPTNKDTT